MRRFSYARVRSILTTKDGSECRAAGSLAQRLQRRESNSPGFTPSKFRQSLVSSTSLQVFTRLNVHDCLFDARCLLTVALIPFILAESSLSETTTTTTTCRLTPACRALRPPGAVSLSASGRRCCCSWTGPPRRPTTPLSSADEGGGRPMAQSGAVAAVAADRRDRRLPRNATPPGRRPIPR